MTFKYDINSNLYFNYELFIDKEVEKTINVSNTGKRSAFILVKPKK